MAIILTLGIVTFTQYEIPEKINFGGTQSLSVKKLVGGQRVIDAMGRDDDDVSWSGLFFGATARERAKFLDQMRVAGTALNLTYDQFSYSVVIRDFKANYERFYQIPYTIDCTIIQDLTKPFPLIDAENYDEVIDDQLAAANVLTSSVNNNAVSTAMLAVNAAIAAVPSLTDATPSQVASIIIPLNIARGVVQTQINVLSASTFS